MLQEGLYSLLSTNSGVTALVGPRIFAVAAPDDMAVYPCAVYKLIGGSSDPTLDTSGDFPQRIEISGFSFNSYAEASKIRAAMILALDGWKQLLSDGTNVIGATILNPGTDLVTEQRCFHCLAEFYVDYTLPAA